MDGNRDVVVVGDIMLDHWALLTYKGHENEAQIVLVKENRYCLGGAANVAANVAGLGTRCFLLGAFCDDKAGARLRDLLSMYKGPVWSHVMVLNRGRTIVKKRYVDERARHEVIMRIDNDNGPALPVGVVSDYLADRVEHLGALLDKPVIVFSDYGKGVCQPALVGMVMDIARGSNSPVLVDPPKHGSWSQYLGPCTVFKANTLQALLFLQSVGREHPELVTGADYLVRRSFYVELFELVQRELTRLGSYFALWLTLGRDGSMISGPGFKEVCVVPGVQVITRHVIGAGDTALAVMASYLSTRELSPDNLMMGAGQANFGAALACARLFTHVLTREELNAAYKDGIHYLSDGGEEGA